MIRIEPQEFRWVGLPLHEFQAFAGEFDLVTKLIKQPQNSSGAGQRVMVKCDFKRLARRACHIEKPDLVHSSSKLAAAV